MAPLDFDHFPFYFVRAHCGIEDRLILLSWVSNSSYRPFPGQSACPLPKILCFLEPMALYILCSPRFYRFWMRSPTILDVKDKFHLIFWLSRHTPDPFRSFWIHLIHRIIWFFPAYFFLFCHRLKLIGCWKTCLQGLYFQGFYLFFFFRHLLFKNRACLRKEIFYHGSCVDLHFIER